MSLDEALAKIGDEIVKEAKINLKKDKKYATGNLYNSIKYIIEDNMLEFKMEQYAYWVNTGRKPGKFVPVNSLNDWMKIKNIPLKYSYPINKKIKEQGIQPTFFFDLAYDHNIEDVEKILDKFADDLFADL